MEKTGWKILAIVFFCLWIVTISLFSWLVWLGTTVVNDEAECSVNVCGDDKYDSYSFDSVENICYCYINHEVVLRKFIGG